MSRKSERARWHRRKAEANERRRLKSAEAAVIRLREQAERIENTIKGYQVGECDMNRRRNAH